jgi:hypothetical protein
MIDWEIRNVFLDRGHVSVEYQTPQATFTHELPIVVFDTLTEAFCTAIDRTNVLDAMRELVLKLDLLCVESAALLNCGQILERLAARTGERLETKNNT